MTQVDALMDARGMGPDYPAKWTAAVDERIAEFARRLARELGEGARAVSINKVADALAPAVPWQTPPGETPTVESVPTLEPDPHGIHAPKGFRYARTDAGRLVFRRPAPSEWFLADATLDAPPPAAIEATQSDRLDPFPYERFILIPRQAEPVATPEPCVPKRDGLTDAELIALATLAGVQEAGMKASNTDRANDGLGPLYTRQSFIGLISVQALDAELRRRGVLKTA